MIFLLFSSISFDSFAQSSNFYYHNGEMKYWDNDSTSLNLIVADTADLEEISNNLQTFFFGKAEVSYSDEDDNIIVTSTKLPEFMIDSIIESVTNNHLKK